MLLTPQCTCPVSPVSMTNTTALKNLSEVFYCCVEMSVNGHETKQRAHGGGEKPQECNINIYWNIRF